MPVLISSGSGSGRSEDEVLLASTLRLLSRGARPSVVVLSTDIAASTRAHPDLHFHPEAELAEALGSCSALLITGDLRSLSRLEHAAFHVAQAKLAGVPVALVAVRLPKPDSMCGLDVCALLAQCESVSASDAQSARAFSECSGERANTAAPLELLLRVERRRGDADGERLGIDEDLLATAPPALVEALTEAAAAAGMSVVAIAHDAASAQRVPHDLDRHATEVWPEWLQEIGDCDVFVGAVNSIALHVAAGQGIVPIAVSGFDPRSDLHDRLGLSDLVLPITATPAQVSQALQCAAAYERNALRAQAATLRTVAWRALGPLAEATRSRPLDLESLAESTRPMLARALEARIRHALEAGDFDFAERELERWRPHLEGEARWGLARAQLEILLGHEGAARSLLQRAVATNAADTECHAMLAMVLWRLGDVDAARREWERVAELEPLSARAPYQIGCLELLRGRMEQALHAWEEASGRDPSHAPSAQALRDTAQQRVRDGAN